ncbi:transcriptional regulator PtsJ [Microbacterium sorbitolivorans]|uniref:Aminotransferase class I/II-fold pyridoxal phosphate-dependent enzyme n=1 Tax=Microbacterium sorbitolivorans TaxID=1867410 RepID=A0A367Y7C4_9MICO|nr:aminotransferase class I/II-fold pyridoxal phosphate-dependent enzyme [Microbacterium sorbitolivorans]RCK61755.1 aminotransferase class I/II-fold pyridoxal phosphate-dependent enzyme [Microbacterium sorbitolivorans]GGF29406.1 transcriptional regulator PtsJ [Microbacterium sorbitolivorans]
MSDSYDAITGSTAAEIASSVRGLIERGSLAPGETLPPVRALADSLGINRNTVVAAYRQLAATGLASGHGRAGTRVASPDPVAQEGFAPRSADRPAHARDVGTGNPDPSLIPDPSRALARAAGRPVLYGSPVVDPELERWATEFLGADLAPDELRITVTGGASDAMDRLFTAMLAPGDRVAIEDPGFLTGIHTLRIGGYPAVPVPIDDEGITVAGLRAALEQGVRAIVCTPRAQNPTGVSLTPSRAAELREVLADHPYVLIIEDDHFSLLSRRPYASLIGPGHERWALVRSVSKFLGPDMSVALVATDPRTAERLGMRLRPGIAWVSHLLQRLALVLLTDAETRADFASAAEHYAARNDAFCAALARHGIRCAPGDGLSVWVPVADAASDVTARLAEQGWIVRSGDEFRVSPDSPRSHHLRVTAHDLTDAEQESLAAAIASA